MTDVDTTQFDNKGSRATVKSMRAKLKINEVRDVDSGEGVGRGRGLVVASCYKQSNPMLGLGILDEQGFGSEK